MIVICIWLFWSWPLFLQKVDMRSLGLFFSTNRGGTRECFGLCADVLIGICTKVSQEWVHTNCQVGVQQNWGEHVVPGSWINEASTKRRMEMWKMVVTDFLFRVFYVRAFGISLRRELWRKTPFLNGPENPGQGCIMHMGTQRGPSPSYFHLKQANNQNSHLMCFWSLFITLWVPSKLSLQIQFQFLDVVEQQLGSVSITLEEWNNLEAFIPPLHFWFGENVVEMGESIRSVSDVIFISEQWVL